VAARVLGEGERWRIDGTDCVVPPSEVIEQRGYAAAVPLIESLAVGPTGELWVRRRTLGSEDRAIDLFDPDGEYLRTVPGDSPFPAAFLPDGRFIVIETDSLDVARIVVHALVG
jgi:hypothetical protein